MLRERLDGLAGVGDRHPAHLAVGGQHHRPARPRAGCACGAGRGRRRARRGGPCGIMKTSPWRSAEPRLLRGVASLGGGPPAEVLLPPRQRLAQLRRTRRSRRGGTSSRRGSRRAPPRPGAAPWPGRRPRGRPGTARTRSRAPRGPRAGPSRDDEVDGHVVRGLEGRPERVGARRGEAGERPRVEARLPQDDGVALDVDAAPAGAAGELRVLPRRQVDVGLAVPLHQPLEHDGLAPAC